MGSRLGYSIVAVAGLALAVWGTGATVRGDDMMPSIEPGDRVWAWPTEAVLPGDVVVIRDPLDPDVRILRRIVAVEGQSIAMDDHLIRVGNRRLRTAAMGDSGDYVVTRETLWAKKPAVGHSWLTRFPRDSPSQWSADPVEVPTGHVYLLADDRDRAMDSRWWGPVPVSAIEGTVRARWGRSHQWRESWEWMVGTPAIRE